MWTQKQNMSSDKDYKFQGKRSKHKVLSIYEQFNIFAIRDFQDIFEKYYYSSQRKEKSLGLPPRPPPLEQPFFSQFRAPPELNPEKDWRMCLTQYRKVDKYPTAVATYEQSVLELSRKIRNKSLPPRKDYTDCHIARDSYHRSFQQSSEAEDDQHTQVCELEIENISSTVFIL